jgi:transposase
MRQELFMARRKRRKFTAEFKAEAVRVARVGDRSIQQIATDLDLTESALRNWVAQADVDAGHGSSGPDALTTSEKAELSELRREVKKLRQERDILKAAATYFAKESE